MLGFLSVLLLASLYKASKTTYYNSFGVECREEHSNCVQDRCIPIGTRQACTQCIPGYVPIHGICTLYTNSISSVCIPDDASSPTRCIACKSETDVFLFYGGCYNINISTGDKMGEFVCAEASGGTCTKCREMTGGNYVFTNSDTGAAEKCILCADTVGFGSYKGVSGCFSCWPPINNKIGTPLCNKCYYTMTTVYFGPVDYHCQDQGSHNCNRGNCTSCYKTHLFYAGGCYSRHTMTGLAICAKSNQYELDNVTICAERSNASYAPKDGACTLVKKNTSSRNSFSECTKDESKGLCTACSSSSTFFLFYGGCYNKSSSLGSRLCLTVTTGDCTQWKGDFNFIFPKDTTGARYLCSDAAHNGIPRCATCSYEGNVVNCTRCSAGYLGMDGKSCNESCDGNTQGACTELIEKVSSAKVLSYQCVCKQEFYNNSGTCAPCAESCAVCKSSDAYGCLQCVPSKILNFSVTVSESTNCIDDCTASGECVECGVTIDGSKYCTRCRDPDMYPFNGVCTADAQRSSYCVSKESGTCTACSQNTFLMSGGCYKMDTYPGNTICIEESGGKCAKTKEGYKVSADGKLQPCAPGCVKCTAPGLGYCTECPLGVYLKKTSSAALTGTCASFDDCTNRYYIHGDACLPCVVPECRACGHTSFCTECAGELFVSLDGRACLRECSGDRVVGEVSGGTRRCWCERGFAPALDRSGCVPAAECPPGMPWCASCDESGRCLSCAAPDHNIQVDQRTCAEGCGDRAAPNQGVCVCEVDAVLTKGACVSAKEVARKRVAAIAGGTMAGVVVVGGLIGFLCWWFLYRGKRAGASSSTTALVRPKSI
ncbi:High cysteine membrane protein Group 4 [Giardia lamblia P15]|uniref:High cysteine membrane protein Group 4 n=1 Tax=Giardia intestinalis (strain P15) TaxID=658858 RepID=E1EZR7_GIAIA|nr:High cysteine membrane protein Group 4 [Giardia lamblia P15]